jgi:hypothetical protein
MHVTQLMSRVRSAACVAARLSTLATPYVPHPPSHRSLLKKNAIKQLPNN